MACSCSATSAALGRAHGCAAVHAATSRETAAGQSPGGCSSRMAPRTGTSPVAISHTTTPNDQTSACHWTGPTAEMRSIVGGRPATVGVQQVSTICCKRCFRRAAARTVDCIQHPAEGYHRRLAGPGDAQPVRQGK